jgi:hypothetical protein
MEINIRNKNKWNQDGIYIGRPSVLSNPFKITEDQTREIVIQRYGYMLINAIQKRKYPIMAELQRLESLLLTHPKQQMNLICYCAPKPCHGDLIKQILLNKFHTNYWLINDKCPTCNKTIYKIGVHGL